MDIFMKKLPTILSITPHFEMQLVKFSTKFAVEPQKECFDR